MKDIQEIEPGLFVVKLGKPSEWEHKAMAQQAQTIPNSIQVISESWIDSEFWVEVPCEDYDAYKALSAGIVYKNYILGKAGWNSDTGRCSYSSVNKFAKGV